MSNQLPSLHVLGAGLCGLYGALEAQKQERGVFLYEKSINTGGLAAGHRLGDNWYDLGVHMLHAFDQEIFENCAEAMSDERIEVPLKAHIKWLGKTYHYPLRGRDILLGLPPYQLFKCVSGLLLAEFKIRFINFSPGEDAESALIEMYGYPLYTFFFEDFTHRYWGMHPKELSAEFVRRKMPRLSAVDVVKNGLAMLKLAKVKDAEEGALRFEILHYSRSGAEALPRALTNKVLAGGGVLHTNSQIKAVRHDGQQVTGMEIGNQVIEDRNGKYLSTIPICDLIPLFTPAPPAEVLLAARALSFKSMVVYALLVKKERCMEALYTYYRARIFHRIGEPKNAGLIVTPSDCTTLIVEMTCEVGDKKWRGDSYPEVLKDLEKEGLCSADEVVEKHLIHSRHAYPIFSKGFETHLSIVNDYLAGFSNFRSTGRQGGFSYPNMHGTMKMGATAVRELFEGDQEGRNI